MKEHYQIAIDGLSGAGKSTLAKALARELHITYIDTGALYRSVGLYMYRHNIDPTDTQAVERALPDVRITLTHRDGEQIVLLNGEDVSAAIRENLISRYASDVSRQPAVRAALGEEFELPIGTPVTGKMVAALKRLGFARVYDTDFAADLTIMEEATELLERIKTGGTLPMITSCSPGWVSYAETWYPDLLGHISTCKSPHEMQGAVLKSVYAEEKGIDPKDIFVVSIMPCTAKKAEKERPQLRSDAGYPDVDAVLTVRELSRMIRRSGIVFNRLPDEEFDRDLMGDASGAGVIFGVTGGVMEAALRTANDWLTGQSNEAVEFQDVRGTKGLKEATYTIAGQEIKVAVASGIANANYVMSKIQDGTAPWTFVEIMCCPGGCVTGGGQPIQPASVLNVFDLKAMRAKALYDQDAAMPLRKSHENPTVKTVYADYLGEIGGHKAHEILHTHYVARKKFR